MTVACRARRWAARALAVAVLVSASAALVGATPSAGAGCPACVNALPPAATISTARGAAAAIPLQNGPPGAYVLVHQAGNVSLMSADGSRLWNRPVASFEAEWGMTFRVADPDVAMGYAPFDPFKRLSNRPYALGGLSGSSTQYLAVAHFTRLDAVKRGTFVTVLDTGTGSTLWFHLYPGIVTQLLMRDGMLVVGHETGDPGTAPSSGMGEVGSRTELTGLRFSTAGDGKLVAQQVWSYSTDTQWARWLAVEPASPSMIAVAWTGTKPGSGGDDYGRIVLLETATGTKRWEVATDSYPRLVRYDAGRNEIVVAVQADPTGELSYGLEALRESDGSSVGSRITRDAAVPFALEVGDVDGQSGSDWVTTDVTMSSPEPAGSEVVGANVSVVRAVDQSTVWRAGANDSTPDAGPGRQPIPPYPYGLALQQRDGATVVLAATYFPGTEPLPLRRPYSGQSELKALSGATGERLWDRSGDILTPLAMVPFTVGGSPGVLTATAKLVVNVYSLADGSILQSTPLLADITAVEATDVNGDGVTDLVVGGQSEAVFALDGRTLGADPKVLWVTPVDGEVHEIHAVSLPNGEKRLVVVAATASVVDGNQSYPIPTRSAIDVLSADTGAVRYRISTLPDYAWTAVVAYLTPDGIPAFVVPTRYLTAYRASDGAQLWRFAPVPVETPPPSLSPVYFSNPAVTADGEVAVQYFVNIGVDAAGQRIRPTSGNSNNSTRVLLDGATGQPLWEKPILDPGLVQLWRGVAVGAATASGTPGVAFTEEVGQHPTYVTQVNVHDLSDGSLSYSNLLSHGSDRGTLVLPNNGLISFNIFNEISTISPQGPVERKLGWPAGHDVAEAHSSRFGNVLVTASEGHGWVGIFDATPGPAGYTRVADWVCGATGGRLSIRDLDQDGSDEIIHYSFDNNAYMAVSNEAGLFSIGGDGGCGNSGLDIYSLGTNRPPIAALTASQTSGTAPLQVAFDGSGSSDPDQGDSIASYTFDFGDGSEPVTESSATVSHTYTDAGTYQARLTVADSHGAKSENAATVAITVKAPPVCFEDDDSHIAFEAGWHTVSDPDASAGHFRLSHGKGLRFDFETHAEQGSFQYVYATSSKGGSSDLYLDGRLVRTLSYRGDSGSLHEPAFGASAELPLSGSGSHTFELRNVSGPAYVDELCLSEGSPDAQPASGPGETTGSTDSLSAGAMLTDALSVPASAESVSILAESDAAVPYRVVLLDPGGNALATADSATNGIASVQAPVSAAGTYLVQFVNLGLGSIHLWAAATPHVKR